MGEEEEEEEEEVTGCCERGERSGSERGVPPWGVREEDAEWSCQMITSID